MDVLAALVQRMDPLNEAVGRAVAWLSLAMVAIAGGSLVVRARGPARETGRQPGPFLLKAVIPMFGDGMIPGGTVLHPEPEHGRMPWTRGRSFAMAHRQFARYVRASRPARASSSPAAANRSRASCRSSPASAC